MGRKLLLGFCKGVDGAVDAVIADMVLVNRMYCVYAESEDKSVRPLIESRHGHPMDALSEVGPDFISVAELLKSVQKEKVSISTVSRYLGKNNLTVLRWVNDRSFPDVSRNDSLISKLKDIYKQKTTGKVVEFFNQFKKDS
ncbi:MAG: hypothetical protein KatS3mg087_0041 [Patescibacteria group bacterium]|nr:MAG: hypothetical protein KatS3mg087_0041 [Patescibacteria group bacterium]